MLTITILNRKTNQKKTIESEAEVITIGRNEDCIIHLDSKTVSRHHAELILLSQDYFIVDLESGNGTFLNGHKIKSHEKNLLRPQDLVRIEEFELSFKLPKRPEDDFADEATDSGIIEIRMIKKVLSALDEDQVPSLEGLVDPIEGKKILLGDDVEEVILGRDPNLSFPIPSQAVSRRHAVIRKKWGGITITDLKSKNGTFVNDERVTEKVLSDGDMIALGNIRFLFRNPQDIDLEAISSTYEAKESQTEEDPMLEHEPGVEEITAHESKSGATVSSRAHASLDDDGPSMPETEEIKPLEKKTPPPTRMTRFRPHLPVGLFGKLSAMERVLLATGALVFLFALIFLLGILL